MTTCPGCEQLYPNGQIICPNCGVNLDDPAVEGPKAHQLLVIGVRRGLVHVGPTITLHVIEVDDMKIVEGTYVAAIPIERLRKPVRIGRLDLNQCPQVYPELELGELLANLQPSLRPVVSRLHAVLQLDEGPPALKPLVDHSNSTWVRHSGRATISPVPVNTLRRLEHRDCIILGNPRSRHVTLRVVLSHP